MKNFYSNEKNEKFLTNKLSSYKLNDIRFSDIYFNKMSDTLSFYVFKRCLRKGVSVLLQALFWNKTEILSKADFDLNHMTT